MDSLIQEYAPSDFVAKSEICATWPSSWLHFIQFRDQIGWHGFGQARRLSSRIGQNVQMLFLQFRDRLASWASLTESVRMPSTGKPKAAAKDRPGPGLTSAWRPDVNGLAIQTQMAQCPRHHCQDLPPSSAVMSKPLQHHCRQELFRSHRVSRTWSSQARPRHTHQRCQGCQNPPHHH